jgi:putative spermidine/putrescine transport system permease protein
MTRLFRFLALAALAFSALAPLVLLVFRSLGAPVFSRQIAIAVATSAGVAIATAVLACLIALPIGRAIARLSGWRRRVAAALAFLPVMAPPIAIGIGLEYAFEQFALSGTIAGVTLAHVVPAASFLSIYFAGVFTTLDPRLGDEARSLGATRTQVWTHLTLPLVRRQIGNGLALGFLVSWAQVPLSLIIGRGLVRTLPLVVYDAVKSGQAQFAAAGALLLMVPPILALAAVRRERVAPL